MDREEVPFQLQGTVSNFPSPPNRSLINEQKKKTEREIGRVVDTGR